MLELATDLLPLLRAGTPVAAVTVTRVIRSAPRGVGATLAVTPEARVIGSISGGCVEGDAVLLGLEALRTGGVRTARFGFAADGAAGFACGGAVEVAAYPVPLGALAALETAAAGGEASAAIVLDGADAGALVPVEPDAAATASGGRVRSEPGGDRVLVLHQRARPRLLILGAGEHAAALCRVGAAAGFAVTVCDAWSLLVTPERFPAAAELVVGLPHEYLATVNDADAGTAVCVLTHDERLDVPALCAALRMPVGFVGAMGARATVDRRAALLAQAGVTDAELARLHSPLGLDLGGASADETAVSVIAEIVAARHGGSGRPLRDGFGPLHRGRQHPFVDDEPARCAAPASAGVE